MQDIGNGSEATAGQALVNLEHLEDVFDRRRRRAVKRDALLIVASDLFNKKGYAATSLDEVAQRLNITKTALYYYVRSKPVLLCECYERTLDLCEALMDQCESLDGSGLERIQTYFRDLISGLTETGPAAVVHEFDVLPEAARAMIHARARDLDHRLEAFLRQGVSDGSMRPLPPKTSELLLMGASNWIQRWYRDGGTSDLSEIADLFVSLFTDGLAPRAAASDATDQNGPPP